MSKALNLTQAERFFLTRKRQGLTQRDAAKEAGVSYATLVAWELGETEIPAGNRVNATGFNVSQGERFKILRARKGLTQRDVAKAIGRSLGAVNAAEGDNENAKGTSELLEGYYAAQA